MAKEKSKKQKSRQKTTKRIGSLGYPVGDFLIRVKNAALALNKEIVVDKTKHIEAVAKVLNQNASCNHAASHRVGIYSYSVFCTLVFSFLFLLLPFLP